jgi:EmrB/QacA subfamily drug resistance transporter
MQTRSKYLIALAAALGLFPIVLDTTIVNVAIVPIERSLHTSVDVVQWIILGYLLANAAMTPPSGYLGIRFGVKRLFLVGICLFTGFSFLCGIAPSQEWLVAFRILQGLGGGLLLPLGMALALDPFGPDERAKAMAVIGIPILLAPVLGPIIGGLVIQNWGWQAIFFINVPIGATALLVNWLVLPNRIAGDKKGKAPFDFLGLVLATSGVALVTYAFKLVGQTNPDTRTALNPQGSINGWGYWLVWALLGISAALLVSFGMRALRSDDPVLDLRLFRGRDFSLSQVVIWMQSTLSFGALFLIPVYLQQLHLPSLSPLDTGVALVPFGLSTVVGMAASAKLYRTAGVRASVIAGCGLMALGCWRLAGLDPTTATGTLWPSFVLLGFSMAFIMVPTQTLALQGLTGEPLNKATSLVTSGKFIFGAIGPAIMVTFFQQQVVSHAHQAATQASASALARAVPGVAAHLSAAQKLAMYLGAQAGASALTDVFTILTLLSLATIAAALFLPGRKATAALAQAEQRPSTA